MTVTTVNGVQRIEYFGLIGKDVGTRTVIAEVLVVRENGRQVSQTETGVTYKTRREATADNARKNGCR